MNKVLERAPYINMQGMQNAIDDLARTLPAAKNAKPEQFVDPRFLDIIEKAACSRNFTSERQRRSHNKISKYLAKDAKASKVCHSTAREKSF